MNTKSTTANGQSSPMFSDLSLHSVTSKQYPEAVPEADLLSSVPYVQDQSPVSSNVLLPQSVPYMSEYTPTDCNFLPLSVTFKEQPVRAADFLPRSVTYRQKTRRTIDEVIWIGEK